MKSRTTMCLKGCHHVLTLMLSNLYEFLPSVENKKEDVIERTFELFLSKQCKSVSSKTILAFKRHFSEHGLLLNFLQNTNNLKKVGNQTRLVPTDFTLLKIKVLKECFCLDATEFLEEPYIKPLSVKNISSNTLLKAFYVYCIIKAFIMYVVLHYIFS